MQWKISELVQKMKQTLPEEKLHNSTVYGWFKKMEKEGIHYITRTVETNEKVYDELDLQIAIFIKKKRNEKWALSVIFKELQKEFELSSFPVDDRETTHASSIQLLEEVNQSNKETAAAVAKEEKSQNTETPKNKDDEKEKRFKEMVARRRVEYQLEREAQIAWATKPEEERIKKRGWFKKGEDPEERNRFIKEYIDKNIENRLRNELG